MITLGSQDYGAEIKGLTLSNKNTGPEKVSFLVFKNHLPSRTFQVPLRWLWSTGALFGLGFLCMAGSWFLAFKYYTEARRADPSQVFELERRLAELQSSYDNLLAQHPPVATETAVETVAAPPVPVPLPESAPAKTTVQPAPAPTTSQAPVLSGILPAQLSSLPEGIRPPALELKEAKVRWDGRGSDLSVVVNYNLYYVLKDGGNQQGRIIVLSQVQSQGRSEILGFPNRVIHSVGREWQVRPDRGEFFSVSRFRRGEAVLSPVSANQVLESVHILVLSRDHEILIHEIVGVPAIPAELKNRKSTPASPVVAPTPVPQPTELKPAELKPTADPATPAPTEGAAP